MSIPRNANAAMVAPTFAPHLNGQYTQTAYTKAAHMAPPIMPSIIFMVYRLQTQSLLTRFVLLP